VAVELVVVQHASKAVGPGDVGITAEGVVQAREAGRRLAAQSPWDRLFTSPLRRAVETAQAIGEAVRLKPAVDGRLTERMNFERGISFEDFLEEWSRTTRDRAFVPQHGDSSDGAGQRFLEALQSFAVGVESGRVVIVSHGGVTTDAARTLVGDAAVRSLNETAIEGGLPPCSISTFAWTSGDLRLQSLGRPLLLPA
jgi:broad specificity phosphatase PhoE